MLIKLRKKGQSTAEYALLITAIIAFLAIAQNLLQGTLKKKAQQAMAYYSSQNGDAGTIDLSKYGSEALPKFEMSSTRTQNFASDYKDKRVTYKGGSEERVYQAGSVREGTTLELDTDK